MKPSPLEFLAAFIIALKSPILKTFGMVSQPSLFKQMSGLSDFIARTRTTASKGKTL